VESYVLVAALYWALTALVSALMMQLERRYAAPGKQPIQLLEATAALATER
jgi:ABC-type arginine/histidine transport system permease subunit